RALVAAAEACGLPWQAGVGAPAGPGPGRAHVRAGGIPTACLDVPVRHRLTPAEMVSLDDLEAAVEILVHFLQSQGLAAV
ncbi:MAG: hypothetical protein IRY95_02235, partial [Clostridia bacterium]|nr:hypothetical protein [Clostridia bacterium]